MEIPSLDQLMEERERRRNRHGFRRIILGIFFLLASAAALAVLVTMLWLPAFRISGESMSPALQAGDVVVTAKADSPAPGDVVSLYHDNILLVKRIIACSGDWVDIKENGDVLVDGVQLDEPYAIGRDLVEYDSNKFPLQVDEGCFFLLGDNRAESVDSRSDLIGCVAAGRIEGRVLFRIWPLNRIGRVQ